MPSSGRERPIPRPRQKACSACANAKVRCDQKTPCTRCQQRGQSHACSYPKSRSPDAHARREASTLEPLQPSVDDTTNSHGPIANHAVSYSASVSAHAWLSDVREYAISSETEPNHVSTLAPKDLVCNIDASKIQNRWLRAFISEPGAKTKSFPPGIDIYISRMLQSYAAMVIKASGTPPFIHSTQAVGSRCSQPLANCFSLLRLFDRRLTSSEHLRVELVEREMRKIYEEHFAGGGDDLWLPCFQAYFLYTLTLLFFVDEPPMDTIRQAMINLQQLACATTAQGITASAEVCNTRPDWSTWRLVESKRRTLYTMYLLDHLLCTRDGMPMHLGSELQGLLAPAGGSIWYPTDEGQWQKAYNNHIALWQGQMLALEELWAIPPHFSENEVKERRRRVDQWLENADEYCTMLFAVTITTHGG